MLQPIPNTTPLPFMDSSLDDEVGKDMYKFLDRFSGYNYVKIAFDQKRKMK